MKHAAFFFLLIQACLAVPASAAILSPADIDAAMMLPPPPAPGSPVALAEIAELHALAASPPAAIAAARVDNDTDRPELFNDVLGFDIAALPVTSNLLNDVASETSTDAGLAKKYFHRDRPWIVDGTIPTCAPHAPGRADNSYPSGHASLAFAVGVMLAALVPEKSQAILARAAQAAQYRLVCGFHFRSDVVAGQQFGTVVALKLMEKPQIQAQMAKARAELHAGPK